MFTHALYLIIYNQKKMSEGKWSKNISVWWNISPEEWFLPFGYHQWLMWGWLFQVTLRISLFFYLPKMDEKIVHVLRKISFSGVHVPLSKCCYLKTRMARMCVSMSVVPVASLVQGCFCLCTRWWGGTAEDTLPPCSMLLNIAFLASLIM